MTRNATEMRRAAGVALMGAVVLAALAFAFGPEPARAVGDVPATESGGEAATPAVPVAPAATATTAATPVPPATDVTAALAASYMERGMFEEAASAFSRLIEADPESAGLADAFDSLGYLYWCRGWNEEALKAFRESLARAADAAAQARARVATSQVLLDMGEASEACSELDQALALSEERDRDIIYTLLGIARFEAGDKAGAADALSRAASALPGNAVALSYMRRLPSGAPKGLPTARPAETTRGILLVNSGASYTLTPHVTLTLGLTTQAAPRGFFLAAGDDTWRWHDWRSPVIEWRLRGERDGKKQLSVVYLADAPRSAASCEASIVLDREPPRGSFGIEGGRRFTNKTRVSLSFLAGDRTSGISRVCMSNDGQTWSAWMTYQLTREWDIPSGDGPKTVYALLQDRAGNISVRMSAEITLDTIPPDLRLISVSRVTSTTAEITWTTEEESDSAVEYVGAGEQSASKAYDNDMTMIHHVSLKELKPATKYRFKVLSRDRAGNLAVSKEREFTTKAAG